MATEDTVKKRGRPRIMLDENTVTRLASEGRTHVEIAAFFGVSDDTISRNYADHIERGKRLMRGSLRHRQFQVAMEGNAQMLIWLGKQELDQVDKSEFTGKVKHEHIDLNNLSDDELAKVKQLVDSAAASGSSLG